MKISILFALAAAMTTLVLLPQGAEATDFWNTDCTKCQSTYNVHACQKECKIYDCGKSCSNVPSHDGWLKDKCQKACPSTPVPAPSPAPAPVAAPVHAPTITVYVPVPVPIQAPCVVPEPGPAPAPKAPGTAASCKCNEYTFTEVRGYATAKCAALCGAETASNAGTAPGVAGPVIVAPTKNFTGFEQVQPPASVVAANTRD